MAVLCRIAVRKVVCRIVPYLTHLLQQRMMVHVALTTSVEDILLEVVTVAYDLYPLAGASPSATMYRLPSGPDPPTSPTACSDLDVQRPYVSRFPNGNLDILKRNAVRETV